MSFFARLNRPWLHFLVLGVALFALQRAVFPPPKPVLGPLAEARVETLRSQWVAATGSSPSEAQLQQMKAAELDREMLFQRALAMDLHLQDQVVYQRLLRNMHFLQLTEGKSEEEIYQQALAMRLHLGDEVVKRRLVQVMEQLLLAFNPPAPVTEAEIQTEFAQRRDALRRPPRYSIEHLYFNREREAEVPAVIERIQAENLSATEARELSSPFLPGYVFRAQSPEQLARHFGAAFAMELTAQEPRPQQWLGPLRSAYGLHYVWVESVEPAREATLEEVRDQLLRDLQREKRDAALAAAIRAMREDYEVRL